MPGIFSLLRVEYARTHSWVNSIAQLALGMLRDSRGRAASKAAWHWILLKVSIESHFMPADAQQRRGAHAGRPEDATTANGAALCRSLASEVMSVMAALAYDAAEGDQSQ
jgi:hypothetical protein